MQSVSDRDRFNIPILEFLGRRVFEEFPDLDYSNGSALHDMILRPAAVMLQPNRDYLRVIARNINLRNFQVMTEEELDGLASNYLIARRSGQRARGIQRVFFREARPVQVGPAASFFDTLGNQFVPTSTVSLTQSQLASQTVASTGEYYLDVPVVAVVEGSESSAAAGTVTRVQGIAGAVRTVNEKSFSTGKNSDSNTELYARILEGVTNRDLVKAPAIVTAVKNEFTSVRAVEVIGFGDEAMQRDTVGVVMAIEQLFPRSFCRKVNLPLGVDGEVKFTEDDGTLVVTPVGGFAGAIVDNLDADFAGLTVTLDGRTTTTVAVQPGFRVRLFDTGTNIDDVGDFVVGRVAEVPVESGGDPVRAIIVNRPFATVSDELDATDRFPYTIVGSVHVDRFHVGGKVDLYIDSTADVEKTVTTTITTDTAGTAEIELGPSTAVESAAFEDGIGFESPVIAIVAVEELDPTTGAVVQTLVPDLHYVHVRKERRSIYTEATTDVLIIRGRDADDVSLFQGARLKITYLTNPDYSSIQQFVDDPIRRDVTKTITVLPPEVALIDIDLSYRGDVTQERVAEILTEFVAEKSLGAEISVNEIVSTLAFFGVTDIVMPVTLTSRYDAGTGVVEVDSSQDRLSIGSTRLFRAVKTLSVEKLS
jgi:hypothetical protein